ncbi:hypothetical protein MRX96_041540 [Rhipicephalus microplus]
MWLTASSCGGNYQQGPLWSLAHPRHLQDEVYQSHYSSPGNPSVVSGYFSLPLSLPYLSPAPFQQFPSRDQALPYKGELESRGIDTVYSHTVMSILLHPDIEPGQLGELGSRVAAVECLRSATEQKAGLEALVDELCRRLNNHLHPESGRSCRSRPEEETFNHRSPRELAQLYYAAFPALENSPQVQAQRVSWDGRHIIELHEREQQNAQCANWELMQEQQLRSKLDSPSLVAIWGRQTSAALETHIFDGFNSVWALSGEDKHMLKIPDDEQTFKMENQNEDTASDNDVSSSLGLAMARIVAKLMDKYNSSLAFFRDDMLFWNWAREESNEPILQAIGTNTEAFASKKSLAWTNQHFLMLVRVTVCLSTL